MAREKIRWQPDLNADIAAEYQGIISELCAQGLSDDELRQQYRDFMPDKPLGRAICESYSKDALAELLKVRAAELGHAPSQSEMFGLYRIYIKHRFGTWPAALRAAGLKYGVKGDNKEWNWAEIALNNPEIAQVLIALVERHITLGIAPTRQQFEHANTLRAYFGDWNTVQQAANAFDQWLEANPTSFAQPVQQDTDALRALAHELDRTPIRAEVSETLRLSLRLSWGSWTEAIHAAGLPVLTEEEEKRARWEYQQRRNAGGCILRLEKTLTSEQQDVLKQLENLCRQYQRAPVREEIPDKLWHGAQKCFGSYRNALFQLGHAPLTKEEANKLRCRQRKQRKGKRS